MIETEGYSKSPEMLAVIPKQRNPGGPFIERIAEKECRDLLCGPERKVSLFSGHMDEEGYLMIPPQPMADRWEAPPVRTPSMIGTMNWIGSASDSGFAGQAADLLAGGGFQSNRNFRYG